MSQLLTVMDYQTRTQDVNVRAPVDPFSEVGQIAQHFNKIVSDQENLTRSLETRVEERTIELASVNKDMAKEIHERQNAERELESALHDAEAANRAKSSFLANMSHELRTPLNSILGFAEVIDQQTFGKMNNDNYEEYIKLIHSSGSHLLTLINEVLDLSKIEAEAMSLKEAQVGVADIVTLSLGLVASTAEGKNITTTSSVPDDLPDLLCDVLRVKQILVNLLGNAVKFTHEGGQVRVVAYMEDNGGIALSVHDNGIGMEQADIKRLFEPFTQSEDPMARNFQGSGLGLSLVQSLAELHSADVTITSEPDKGTQATIHFPPERTKGP